MDPVSIVTAAMTAATGAWEIFTLCNDAKHVNETVRGLAKEAQAVGDACDTVAKRLEGIIKEVDAADSPSNKLQDLLVSRISNCQETITQLRSSLQGLDNGSLNFLEKLGKQIRLNVLQLILHVLLIEVSYLIPRKADQYLCSLIAKVEQQMEQLLASKLQDSAVRSSEQNALLTYSKETIVHADDLYRESQANGSVGPPPTEERIREVDGWAQEVSEFFDLPKADTNRDRMSSFSSGSGTLVGDDQRTKRARKTILDVSLQVALSKAALNKARLSYRQHNFAECMSHLRKRSDLVSVLPEAETIICNNEESEFRLALALECLKASKEVFDTSGWSSSRKHLLEATELVRPLPADLHDEYQIQEAVYTVLPQVHPHFQDTEFAYSRPLCNISLSSVFFLILNIVNRTRTACLYLRTFQDPT